MLRDSNRYFPAPLRPSPRLNFYFKSASKLEGRRCTIKRIFI